MNEAESAAVTGVKTLAARDGMKLELDHYQAKQQTLDEFSKNR